MLFCIHATILHMSLKIRPPTRGSDTAQINVRVPKPLVKAARLKALQEDRTLPQVVADLLEKWLKKGGSPPAK